MEKMALKSNCEGSEYWSCPVNSVMDANTRYKRNVACEISEKDLGLREGTKVYFENNDELRYITREMTREELIDLFYEL